MGPLFVCQVAVRSILLRGFDQQVAEKLGDVMKNIGVKFVRPAIPSKIEKVIGSLQLYFPPNSLFFNPLPPPQNSLLRYSFVCFWGGGGARSNQALKTHTVGKQRESTYLCSMYLKNTSANPDGRWLGFKSHV